jgi:glycerol-3-phosphate dehydrogenase
MVMLTADDGRPMFAIGRGSVTYVGTTDTTVEGGPDLWPDVGLADVEYLLEPLERYFPENRVGISDIVSAWAGLRPLINQPGKAAREMSRKEEIWREGRLVTIAGGKLTGFRIMAEQAMAKVADVLDRPLELSDPLAPLPGGEESDLDGLLSRIVARYGTSEQTGRRLMRLYGSEVFEVLGAAPTTVTGAVFAEELDWAVEHECAVNVEDVVYRRLRIPWFHPEDTEAVGIAAASVLASRFDWSPARRQQELDALVTRLRRDLTFSAP